VRIVAFRHVPYEGCGVIHDVLEPRGVSIQYADRTQPPDLTTADALIFLGGPMSVNDGLPYLECEMAIIREAVARRQPVLGICLGSQLIAKALGAEVRPNPAKEIGWYDLKFTEAGLADPLFRGVRPVEMVFHWHYETFGLPKGAELLASSELCVNQAVRFNATSCGLQFHLEVTPEMISDWCQRSGYKKPLHAQAYDMTQLAATVFANWYGVLSLGR